MKWHIPLPLGFTQRVVTLAADPTRFDGLVGGASNADHVCRSGYERGSLATDLVIMGDPRWRSWAVEEALRGRLPRTTAYVVPTLSGAQGVDLGRGPLRIPMAFGGATCHPRGDGHLCDHPSASDLPEHEALAPRRVFVEDAGDVVFDDFEDGLAWPAFVVEGGEA